MNEMSLFYKFAISTLFISTLLIILLIYWNNKQGEKRTEKKDNVLKLQYGRILLFGLNHLFFLLLFIYFFFLISLTLIEADNSGISISFRNISIFESIFYILLLTLFFIAFVPDFIVFCQFLIIEIGRTIIFNDAERSIEVITRHQKIDICNSNVKNIEFNFKKQSMRKVEVRLDYLKITTKENKTVIFTDLLIPIKGSSVINSVYKGARRTYNEKYFNRINCG
jgi:hypothetical protein